MSNNTNIEWASSTGSPWIGCTKVSPGCKNCYAETLDKNRFSKTMGGGTKEKPVSHWGKGAPRFKTKGFWKEAVQWNNKASVNETLRNGIGFSPVPNPRVFPSLCDWLDDEVPIEWLAEFLNLIYETPNLDWLLLTKRPENFSDRIAAATEFLHPEGNIASEWLRSDENRSPQNVWIGVSVEDQKRADERIPQLLAIPAAVRFLSVEPLLEKVVLPWKPDYSDTRKEIASMPIDWCIVGGESGPDRRDCGVEAIVSVAEQCRTAGVPCFVKQDSAFKPGQQGRIPDAVWALKQFPISTSLK